MKARVLFSAVLFLVIQCGYLFAETITLLPKGSTNWYYTDKILNGNGVAGPYTYPTDNEGDQWFEPDFNVATSRDRVNDVAIYWFFGQAPLGYGTIDGATLNKIINGSSGAATVTTDLFRKDVNIPDPTGITALDFSLLCDDGGILYLNGQEIYRTPNMPEGTVETTTLTMLSSVNESYNDFSLPVGNLLVPGINWFAFELHQTNWTSSDAGFDLAVDATLVPEPSTMALLALGALALVVFRRK